MQKNTTKQNNTMKTTVSAPNNSVGSAILALSGMLSSTYSKKPTGKQIKCRIALEKAGIIIPVADRVKTNKTLSGDAYKSFAKIAKSDVEPDATGAARVIELAKQLSERTDAIAAYKAANPGAVKKAAPAKAAPAKKFAKKTAKPAAKAAAGAPAPAKKKFFFRGKKG